MDFLPDLGSDTDGPPRMVIYERHATEHLDQMAKAYPRLFEIMQYIEWQLARHPANDYAEQMPFPNSDTWAFKVGPYASFGIPSVLVLYQFTESKVTIWDIRVSLN